MTVSYTATISDIPKGTRYLNVWVPLPIDDSLQEIKDLKIETGQTRYEITTDAHYGNRMIYLHLLRPSKELKVKVSFKLRRWEDFMAFSEKREFKIPWELTMVPSKNIPSNATIDLRVKEFVKSKSEKKDRPNRTQAPLS